MIHRTQVEQYLKKNFADACDRALKQLDIYHRWLLEENRKVNLISRKTDPDAIWILHFLDSLLSTSCVEYHRKQVIDIGTGGGFPGVPLAILYPDAHFTLLDSTRKKIESVKNGISALGLKNCSFLDTRLEAIPADYSGSFDIAVCRSVRVTPEYKTDLLRLLTSNGQIVLYKSRKLDDAAQFPKVTITDVSTPLIGERKIIVINKSDCI